MRKILVVVDMQNDFIDGALGTKEAVAIVPNVVEKIKEYDPWNVYLTRDTHYENYLDTQEGRNLPVPHCIKDTHGWEICDAVKAVTERAEATINKPTFGSAELASKLMIERAKEALEIELVGLCTDICVVSNALLLKAAMPEAPITVDGRCCAGVTPESHRHALETMKACQVKVIE
ncbi:MAG: cysteine hydrolase [Oscillospiraceae bacterium]|nr:cysteine hydrolase [Oscillospiraceae bacterium]